MGQIRKFRDQPDWQEVRKSLKEEVGLDPQLIAEFGETEGDSLDLVEATIAIEEAFGSRLKKKGLQVDLGAQGK